MMRLAPAENPPRCSHLGSLQSRKRERIGTMNLRERNAGFNRQQRCWGLGLPHECGVPALRFVEMRMLSPRLSAFLWQ
jgi:hypothetical protein